MDYESTEYEADYWQGVLVITDKATGQCGCVSLKDNNGRNITLRQLRSGIKTHGVDRTFATFAKLVTNWE